MNTFKRQILIIRSATKIRASWTASIVLISLLFSVCVAHGLSAVTREIVVVNLENIRLAQVDILMPDEFRSVEDALKKADSLRESGDKAESETYYRLAYVKTEMLEKHLEEEKGKIGARKTVHTPSGGSAEKLEVPQAEQIEKVPELEKPQAPPAIDKLEKGEPEKNPSAPGRDAATGATDVDKSRTPTVSRTSGMLIGSEITYVVKKRESIKMVSAKTGVNRQVIAKDNGLDPKKPLQAGQILRINTRRIVPKTLDNGIVINIPDRTLYFFREGKLHNTYPVGLGMTKKGSIYTWQTPIGKFKITSKSKDPIWNVPLSLQQELKSEGKIFQKVMPPGPGNPLGKFALHTNLAGILIHSTISPESIYSFSSHGCVRMMPRDMETFFNTVRVNTRGEIIYQPVKVAISDEGRVFLEVHADAYKMVPNLETTTKKLLEEQHAVELVDWKKVKALLRSGNGKVEDITL